MNTEPNDTAFSVNENGLQGLTKIEYFSSQNMAAALKELLFRVGPNVQDEALELWAKISVRSAKALITALNEQK
jgi:hypothetical protein